MFKRVELTHSFKTLPQWTQCLLTALIALSTGLGVVQLQLSRLAQLDSKANQQRTKAEYILEEKLIKASVEISSKLPFLGFDNLIADWTFLSFIQYFGDDEARPKTGYRAVPGFFKLAVARDPHFLEMYPYLSASVSLYAGQPQQTVQLLQKGIQSIPQSMQSEAYFLWQAKATDELLFLGRTQDARRSYERAASWASQSNDSQLQAIFPPAQSTGFAATCSS